MSRSIITTGALLFAIAASGCSFHARDAESYRKVTREVLETRNGDIKACYDKQLEKDPKASGTVTVAFLVEKDTGVIKNLDAKSKQSTAPAELQECILKSLEGLKIDPPDARDGKAAFTWDMQAGKS